MKAATFSNVHPMVVFWIGVLTGALVVGFVFLYQSLNNDDYKSALLKYTSPTSTSTQLNLKGTSIDPYSGPTGIDW